MFPRFQGENLEYNLKEIEVLKEMAQQKGVTAGQLVLAWALNQGEDIIPILGMSSPKRIAENLQALDIVFTAEEANTLLTLRI